MTPTEYTLLNNPRLSHPARTLYWLHLRHTAQSGLPVIASYPDLGRALAIEDPQLPGGFSYQVNASQLTRLFDELIATGLLVVQEQPQPEHYHRTEFSLPALHIQTAANPLPMSATPMTPQWRPNDSFHGLAQLCGLFDASYSEEELGEFIAYWLGRPETFATNHQWMLKFIKALKARRYTKAATPSLASTSYQPVPDAENTGPSQRALEMIAEARRLQTEPQGEKHEED